MPPIWSSKSGRAAGTALIAVVAGIGPSLVQPDPAASTAAATPNRVAKRRPAGSRMQSVVAEGSVVAVAEDLELDAAVLGAADVGVVRFDRLALAEALRLEPRLRDAFADQVLHHGRCALRAELQVASVAAHVVGVAVDADPHVLAGLHQRRDLVQDREADR